MLVRDKKLTVTFFLNQRLKPHVEDNGELSYPIYVQVSYNQKNHQFKVNWDLLFYNYPLENRGAPAYYGYVSEKIFDEVVGLLSTGPQLTFAQGAVVSHRDGLAERLHFLKENISAIVDYEVNQFRDNFRMKGLSSRIDFYLADIMVSLDNHCNTIGCELMRKQVNDIEPTEVLNQPYFFQNYEALRRLGLLNGLSKAEQLDFELYFLVGAFIDSTEERTTNLNWLAGNLKANWAAFCDNNLPENRYLDAIPPHNYFFRHLRLVPPAEVSEFYTARLAAIISEQATRL